MRIISADAIQALETERFGVRALVKLILDAPLAPFCAWDDLGSITVGGDTYVGAAGRFTLNAYASPSDFSAQGLDITWTGLDSAVVALLDSVAWHQRPVVVQRAIIATDKPQILHLVPEFSGFLDEVVWREHRGGESELVWRCESAARQFSRSGGRTASDADQRERDPLDGFFSFSSAATSTPIDWGRMPEQAVAAKKPGLLTRLFSKIF